MENKLGQESAFPAKSKRIVVGRTEVATANSDGSASMHYHNEYGELYQDGMTKRFYAACAAMQGLLANASMIDNHSLQGAEWIAKHAFIQADELLKQENE